MHFQNGKWEEKKSEKSCSKTFLKILIFLFCFTLNLNSILDNSDFIRKLWNWREKTQSFSCAEQLYELYGGSSFDINGHELESSTFLIIIRQVY